MINRVIFITILLLWLAANYMLYQYENANRRKYTSSVPIETVWKKVLTSPDPSSLEIYSQDKRIGTCRWSAGAGEEQMRKFLQSDEGAIQTPLPKPSYYTIDLDGNVRLSDLKTVARFYFHASLPDEKNWSNILLRVSLDKATIYMNAIAKDETVNLKLEAGKTYFDRTFKFSELLNPSFILQSLGVPLGGLFLPEMPLIINTNSSSTNLNNLGIQLDWKAYHDNMTVGKVNLKVYRVEAVVWGKFKAVATISRAGEILKIELPENITLINTALANY